MLPNPNPMARGDGRRRRRRRPLPLWPIIPVVVDFVTVVFSSAATIRGERLGRGRQMQTQTDEPDFSLPLCLVGSGGNSRVGNHDRSANAKTAAFHPSFKIRI